MTAAELAAPPAVALCFFRSCTWTSDTVPTAPPDVADGLIVRHLLRDHQIELRTLGRLAEEAHLL